MLVAGVGVSLVGIIPERRELVSLIISDLPAKITILLVPVILIFRTKTYSEWSAENPSTVITKKGFINAIYLEVFLSSFLGLSVLALIWAVAHLVSPGIVDLNEGFGVLGGSFGIVWGMIALVYSLQFTKLGQSDEMLLAIGFFVPFGIVVAIQQAFHAIELSLIFIAGIPALVGFIMFMISRPIAVSLQEKIDL